MWVCSSCHHKQPGGVEVSVRYSDVSGHFTYCWHHPSQQQQHQYEYLMGYRHPVSLVLNGLRTAEWRISVTLCHSDLLDTVLGFTHEIRAVPWGPWSKAQNDRDIAGAEGFVGRYTAVNHLMVWTKWLWNCLKNLVIHKEFKDKDYLLISLWDHC